MRLAIFGGTFNPIHSGHIGLAVSVHFELGYDIIQIIPNGKPPLKVRNDNVSSEDRLAMIRLAINDFPFLKLNEYEVYSSSTSYTIDTIQHLYRSETFDGKLGLIIGSDQASQFEQWKDYKEILSLVDLIIAKRGDENIDFKYDYIPLKNRQVDISSTQIRAHPLLFENMVNLNTNVVRYIINHHLYGAY